MAQKSELIVPERKEQLFSRFGECIRSIAEQFRIMADVVKEVQEGDPENGLAELQQRFPEIQNGVWLLLRRAASGQMLPEVYHRFDGRVREAISLCSIPIQRRILEGGSLRVMLPGGDHLMIAAENLDGGLVSQVFDRGSIRSDEEQIAYLLKKSATIPKAEEAPEIRIDKKRGVIVITGPCTLDPEQLARYLSKLASR